MTKKNYHVCSVHFSQWWSKIFLVTNVNNYVTCIYYAEVLYLSSLQATHKSMLTFMSAQRQNTFCTDHHLKLNISKPWSIQSSEVYHGRLFWTHFSEVMYFPFPPDLVELLFSEELDKGSYEKVLIFPEMLLNTSSLWSPTSPKLNFFPS